mgnify:CR=1 FL=1
MMTCMMNTPTTTVINAPTTICNVLTAVLSWHTCTCNQRREGYTNGPLHLARVVLVGGGLGHAFAATWVQLHVCTGAAGLATRV